MALFLAPYLAGYWCCNYPRRSKAMHLYNKPGIDSAHVHAPVAPGARRINIVGVAWNEIILPAVKKRM